MQRRQGEKKKGKKREKKGKKKMQNPAVETRAYL
jgi:hypothetical protein